MNYKTSDKKASIKVVNKKAIAVVGCIWFAALICSLLAYLTVLNNNKIQSVHGLSYIPRSSKNAAFKSEENQPSNDETYIFVKYPNKKLVLTRYSGLNLQKDQQLSDAESFEIGQPKLPVIIKRKRKPSTKSTSDFYISNVPK